jgi:hypothetical protein
MAFYAHSDDKAPSGSIAKITPGSALPRGTCRAILCGTAGTLDCTDAEGNVLTALPIQQGYNPIALSAVANTGTASNLWALY